MGNIRGCALFTTPLGDCAIAWNAGEIAAIQLPERTRAMTLRRLRALAGDLPETQAPPWVRKVIQKMVAHLAGNPQDFTDLPLNLGRLSPFIKRVYQAARLIQPGFTASYGELAEAIGSPRAARAVGMAMARNPFPIVVPCHRIVGGNGRPGGFSARGGLVTKEKLLAIEGVRLSKPKALFDGSCSKLPFDAARASRTLKHADSRLATLMERVGPFTLKIESLHSPYEALSEAIIFQQLNGKAASSILAKYQQIFGGGRFPAPHRLLSTSNQRLREAGLSRPKIQALKDLAARVLDGSVPSLRALRRLGDEEIVTRLTGVRGIGRWTVEMLLIFRLGRPDVFPATDYGIRKGLSRLLGKDELLKPQQVAAYGERFRPYRTMASWYLWRLLELPQALD